MKGRTSWPGVRTTMGTYHLEDKKKFPLVELYCVITTAIPFLSGGILQSIMPQIMKSMRNETAFRNSIKAEDAQWMWSTPHLGAVVGAILSALLLEFLGRKRTIFILNALYIPGWLLAGLATNVPMLFSGVALIGAATGMAFTTVPIYIAECVPAGRRGRLVLVPFLIFYAGVAVLISPTLQANWRIVTWTMSGLCKVASIISIWLPESPTWLLLKGRETEAYDCLAKIRGTGREHLARPELDEIMDGVEQAKESTDNLRWLNVIRRQVIWWPMLLTLSLLVFQQFLGINAVIYHMENILSDVVKVSGRRPALSPELANTVEGIVQLIPALLALVLIDWIGRRALLLISTILIIISHVSLGTYFYSCHQHIELIVGFTSWLPSASLYALLASYSLGYASVPFLIMSEVLPAKWRSNIAALCVLANSAASFLIVHFFEYLRHSLYAGYVFFLFGIICVIACIVIIFAMPETRGESLARIQRSFDDNAGYFNEDENDGKGTRGGLRSEGFKAVTEYPIPFSPY